MSSLDNSKQNISIFILYCLLIDSVLTFHLESNIIHVQELVNC